MVPNRRDAAEDIDGPHVRRPDADAKWFFDLARTGA
jgi:hypothetical protein